MNMCISADGGTLVGKRNEVVLVFFPPLTLFPPLNVSVHLSVPSCQVRRCWQSTACLSVHLSVSRPRPRHRCLHLTFSLWLLMNEFCYSEKRRFWWTMIILIFQIFPVYKLLLFFFFAFSASVLILISTLAIDNCFLFYRSLSIGWSAEAIFFQHFWIFNSQ